MRDQDKEIIQNTIDQIKSMIVQERWSDGHRICVDLLRYDPDNIEVIKLKNKIEAEVTKINRSLIKKDLDSLKPLWESKNYPELLAHLKKLEPYLADYPELAKIIIKATNEYENSLYKNNIQLLEQGIKDISMLIKENKFSEAHKICEKLKLLGVGGRKLEKCNQTIKTKWIDYLLNEKKGLLDSNNYESIKLFLQELHNIDLKSALVEKLKEKYRKKEKQFLLDSKRDFIYKSIENIKIEFQLKKYDVCMIACRELLNLDPTNSTALRLFKASRKKLEKQEEAEIYDQIKQAAKKNKKEMEKDKSKFIRL